ncbi:MAG: hypothetical protein NC311_13800, partial [Muribaculaceae bacterium]|nr:hypothetical protein [Muribaculaceae bacterium]
VEATKTASGATQSFTITVPSDQETLKLTLTPEMPVTKYILFAETDASTIANPAQHNASYYEGLGYEKDDDPNSPNYGLYNARKGIKLDTAKVEETLDIYLYVPSGKYDEAGKEILQQIPVTLVVKKVSTDRSIKSITTNKGDKDAEHKAVYNMPANGQFLTYIPDSDSVTTAVFDITLGYKDAQAKVIGSDPSYKTGVNGEVTTSRTFSKALDNYVTISQGSDTKGFKMDISVLSAYGQMRIQEMAADPTVTDEELAKEYNKHTLTHTVYIVPTVMELDVKVFYTRIGANEKQEELLRDENNAYSVFDYKSNSVAQYFNVTSTRASGVKLELLNDKGQVVYDSATAGMGALHQIVMRQDANPLSTGFTTSTKDDAETHYTIRISSTKDGVVTQNGVAFLNREFPFTIRPMGEDTDVTVEVAYESNGQTIRKLATRTGNTFSTSIGLETTAVTITITGTSVYARPALDMLGLDNTHGGEKGQEKENGLLTLYGYPTLEGTTGADAQWSNMWAMAETNNSNVFQTSLVNMTESWGEAKTVQMRVQVQAQAGNKAMDGGTYGYNLNLNRLSDKTGLHVVNDDKRVTDPDYYEARNESTETENILVLYLDAYTPATTTTGAKGDRRVDNAILTPDPGASMKIVKANGQAVGNGFSSTLLLGAKNGPLDRGTYYVTVEAADGEHTAQYTLIVKDKGYGTTTGFVVDEDRLGHFNIFHDSLDSLTDDGKSLLEVVDGVEVIRATNKEWPYIGRIAPDAETLKFDPVDRNSVIQKIVRYSDSGFNNPIQTIVNADLVPDSGLLYGKYEAIQGENGKYWYGAAVITDGLKGENDLYYSVTIRSQATDNPVTATYYLRLERETVTVAMDSVSAKAGNTVSNGIKSADGKQFNLNVVEPKMELTMVATNTDPKDLTKVKITGFAANEASLTGSMNKGEYVHSYVRSYTNEAAEGQHATVYMQVTDTGFWREETVNGQTRILTPNARGTFTADIFRSNHDTDVDVVWLVSPNDPDWKIAAIRRANNPTVFDVAAPDEMKGELSFIKDGKVNVQVDASRSNPYATIMEVNPAGTAQEIGTHTSKRTAIYNQSAEGTGILDSIGEYNLTSKPLTTAKNQDGVDFNFYVVSSSAVREQWYTVHIYKNDKDATGTQIYLNGTKAVFTDSEETAGNPEYVVKAGDRTPATIAVKGKNAMEMIVLRNGDGQIVNAALESANFQDLPITKLGRNVYTVTTLSPKAYLALRELGKGDVSTRLAAMMADGTLAQWLKDTPLDQQESYDLVLDYYADTDTGISGIAVAADNIGAVSYINAQLVELGEGRSAYLVRLPDKTNNARIRVERNNTQQQVAVTLPNGDVRELSELVTTIPDGINHFTVTITAVDGVNTASYDLYILRATAALAELKVNGQVLKSSRGSYEYTVPAGTQRIRIEATASSDLAMVSIGASGEKHFVTDWAELELTLSVNKPTQTIPVYVYTFNGTGQPYSTASMVVTNLVVRRDNGKYRPTQVLFTPAGSVNGTSVSLESSYGRYATALTGGATAATLTVVTASADHEVVLHDFKTGKDVDPDPVKSKVNMDVTGKVAVSRTYVWNLSNLTAGQMYNISVVNNMDSGVYTSYPLILTSHSGDATLAAVQVNRGLGDAQKTTDISSTMTFEVDRRASQVTLTLTATDADALVSAMNGTYSGVGRLEITVPLTGEQVDVPVSILSSNGQVGGDYTVTLTKTSTSGSLQKVVLDGKTLSGNGDMYAANYTAEGNLSLKLNASESGVITLWQGSTQIAAASAPLGEWNGTVNAAGLRSSYTIKVNGEYAATLFLQLADYATGVKGLQVAYGDQAVAKRDNLDKTNGAATGNKNTNWQSLKPSTVYDPAGNAFTVYELKVGSDDNWVELELTALNSTAKMGLGHTYQKGLRDEGNYAVAVNGASGQSIFTRNGNGISVDGTGRFSLNLDELLWLDMKLGNKAVDVYNDASMKEAYVDLTVTDAVTGVSRIYTVHILRVNDDASLRRIQVVGDEETVATGHLYDNVETGEPERLGDLEVIKDVDASTELVDVYRISIDDTNTKIDLSVRATDDAAMVTLSEPDGKADDPAEGDASSVTHRNVPVTEEMTQFEIKVRSEDGNPGSYKTSYLQVFRTNSNAELKDVILTYPYDAKTNLNVHGILKDDPDAATGKPVYEFVVSSKMNDKKELNIANATLTAIAKYQGAQVQFTQINAKPSLGQDVVNGQTIGDSNIYHNEYQVTVTSSNGKKSQDYLLRFTVVDLELDTLNVGVTSTNVIDALPTYYVETINGVETIIYYAVVPENTEYVSLEVQTSNNHNLYKQEDKTKASTLAVSELDSTVTAPTINSGSRVYRKTQKLSEEERSQFQIKVANHAVPGDPTTPQLVNTKYLRVYRSNSNTRPQKVIVYYEERPTGKIIAVEAILDEADMTYRAYVPDYVELTDIELIGPSDLSYLKLT